MKIDAHQHYWHFDPVRDAWITPAMSAIRRDFLPPDVAPDLATAGITGVIAVQADQSVAETRFLVGLAAKYPVIRGVVGWVDLLAPDLDDQLARWRASTVVVGFRHIAQAEPDAFLARADVIDSINRVGHHGFAYDILIYPRQLAAAETLARRCSGVRLILDHCAKPPIASGESCEWQRGIERLARHSNVYCKISGLVTEASRHGWTAAQLTPYLDIVAQAFGIDRLIFGSDWPVCLLAARYRQVVGVIEHWTDRLTSAERNSVFGGAAALAYHLEN